MADLGDISAIFSVEVPDFGSWLDLRDTYTYEDKPFPRRSLEKLEQLWDHSHEDSINLIPNKSELFRRNLDKSNLRHFNSAEKAIPQFAKSAINLGFSEHQLVTMLKFVFKPEHIKIAEKELRKVVTSTKKPQVTHSDDKTRIVVARIVEAGMIDKEVMFNIVAISKKLDNVLALANQFRARHDALHNPKEIVPTHRPVASPGIFEEHPDDINKSVNFKALARKVAKLLEQKVPAMEIYSKMANHPGLIAASVRAQVMEKAMNSLDQVHRDVFKGVGNSPNMSALARKMASQEKIFPLPEAEERTDIGADKIVAQYNDMFDSRELDISGVIENNESFKTEDISFAGGLIID